MIPCSCLKSQILPAQAFVNNTKLSDLCAKIHGRTAALIVRAAAFKAGYTSEVRQPGVHVSSYPSAFESSERPCMPEDIHHVKYVWGGNAHRKSMLLSIAQLTKVQAASTHFAIPGSSP